MSNRGSRPWGWGLALIGLGVTWMLELSGVAVAWERVAAVALIVIGLVLVSVARRGAQDGLIGLGVVVAVIALATTVGPAPVPVSAGERTFEVTERSDLESSYALGAGDLTLDLRGLELTDEATSVTADVGLGELVVRVPQGVAVTGTARAGMGDVVAFDQASDGISPSVEIAEDGPPDAARLELDLRVGLGSVEVTR